MKFKKGLSLLEVEISIAILFIVMTFAALLFGGAIDISNRSQFLARADFLAEQKMEETLYQKTITAGSGSFSAPYQNYSWNLSINPYSASYPNLKTVQVMVSGPNGVRTTLVSIKPVGTQALAIGPGMAVDTSGNVWLWGWNTQCSNPPCSTTSTPVKADGSSGSCCFNVGVPPVLPILTGTAYQDFVIGSNGTGYSWGENGSGVLNNGDGICYNSGNCVNGVNAYPKTLVLPSSGGWTSFSGGIYQTAVGINNQKLLVWGGNVYGALGNGYTGSGVDTNIPQDYDPTPTTPIQNSSYPPGGNSFTNIVLSAVGDNYHGLALDTYGHVWAWGDDEYGQLGINGGPAKCGTTISCSWKNTSLPYGEEFCGGAICEIYLTEVLNSSGSCCLSNIVAIATGRRDSYAIDSSGHVWAWGDNTWGQLGYSSSFPNQGPVKYSYTCYETDSSGTLIGELTPGYPINYSPLPVEVRDSTGAPFNVGTPSQAQIAVGEDDVLVIKSDGSVWTWGEGGDGLGIGVTTGPDTYTTSPYYQEVVNADGSTTCQSTTSTFDYAPYSVEVNNTNNSCCLSLLSLSGGITTPQVAAWTDQPTFIVLANTGKIYSWGSNEWGMLGDGSTSSSSYPVEVTNF